MGLISARYERAESGVQEVEELESIEMGVKNLRSDLVAAENVIVPLASSRGCDKKMKKCTTACDQSFGWAP